MRPSGLLITPCGTTDVAPAPLAAIQHASTIAIRTRCMPTPMKWAPAYQSMPRALDMEPCRKSQGGCEKRPEARLGAHSPGVGVGLKVPASGPDRTSADQTRRAAPA